MELRLSKDDCNDGKVDYKDGTFYIAYDGLLISFEDEKDAIYLAAMILRRMGLSKENPI